MGYLSCKAESSIEVTNSDNPSHNFQKQKNPHKKSFIMIFDVKQSFSYAIYYRLVKKMYFWNWHTQFIRVSAPH